LYNSVKRDKSRTFNLGLEACERAIVPVLKYCMKKTSDEETISERLLFRGFCEVAPKPLKNSLAKNIFPLDLDYLGQLELLPPIIVMENFNELAWQMICRAYETAQVEGSQRIRTHHLMAALLIDAEDSLGRYLKSYSINISDIYTTFSQTSPQKEISICSSIDMRPSFNLRTILCRAVRIATKLKRQSSAGVEDILYASLSDWDMIISSMKGIRK